METYIAATHTKSHGALKVDGINLAIEQSDETGKVVNEVSKDVPLAPESVGKQHEHAAIFGHKLAAYIDAHPGIDLDELINGKTKEELAAEIDAAAATPELKSVWDTEEAIGL